MCESRSNPRLRAWLSNNKHNLYSRGDQKVLGSYLKTLQPKPHVPNPTNANICGAELMHSKNWV